MIWLFKRKKTIEKKSAYETLNTQRVLLHEKAKKQKDLLEQAIAELRGGGNIRHG